MRFRRTTRRPDEFRLDPNHLLAEGLVFAGLPNAGHVGSMILPDARRWLNREPNDGTLSGADPGTFWGWSPELGCPQMKFDGSDDYVLLPQLVLDAVTGSATHTLSFWIRSGDLGNNSYSIGGSRKDSGNLLEVYHYGFTTGNRAYWKSAYGPNIILESGVIDDGQWHSLVAVARSLTSHEIWTDGALADSDYVTDLGATFTGGTGGIGYDGVNFKWPGEQSDSLWWNRALSPAEIKLVASRGPMLGGLIVPERRWWPAAVAGAPPTGIIVNRTIAVQHAA